MGIPKAARIGKMKRLCTCACLLMGLALLGGCGAREPEELHPVLSKDPRVAIVGVIFDLYPDVSSANRKTVMDDWPLGEPLREANQSVTLQLDRLSDRFLLKIEDTFNQLQFMDAEEVVSFPEYQHLPVIDQPFQVVPQPYRPVLVESLRGEKHTLLEAMNAQVLVSLHWTWKKVEFLDVTPAYRLNVILEGATVSQNYRLEVPLDLYWHQLSSRYVKEPIKWSKLVVREGTRVTLEEGPYLFHSENRKRYDQAVDAGVKTVLFALKKEAFTRLKHD